MTDDEKPETNDEIMKKALEYAEKKIELVEQVREILDATPDEKMPSEDYKDYLSKKLDF